VRSGLRLRPAAPEDIGACEGIWRASIDAYTSRLNQPPVPEDNPGLRRLFAHTMATDPERFRVAVRDGDAGEEVVAFGSAVQRGRLWYLSMLFVLPELQGAGLGRALLGAIGPDPAVPPEALIRATATDSAQPISNALYASLGIVPRTPLWRFVGEWGETRPLPPLPSGIVPFPLEAGRIATRDAAEADALDRATLGVDHAPDRGFLIEDGRRAWGYRDGSGRLVAHGWASEAGRIGPVAAADPELLPAVVGHLVTAVPPRGAVAAWVPGSATGATVALLGAGWRMEPFPILLCWDRAPGDLAGYLPLSPGLL
jgi:GNAT superfamily N-acetyltransferase